MSTWKIIVFWDASARGWFFLFFLYQYISRRDDESEGKDGHRKNLPDFHFIEAQDKHHGDDEKNGVEEIAGNDAEFRAFFFFLPICEPRIKKSQNQDRDQDIFGTEVGADNSGKNQLRNKKQEISDDERNQKIF